MWPLLIGVSLALEPGVGKAYCLQESSPGSGNLVTVDPVLSSELGCAENARRIICTTPRGNVYDSAFEEDYTPGEIAVLLIVDGLERPDRGQGGWDILKLASLAADRHRFLEALDRRGVQAELDAAGVSKANQKIFYEKLDLAVERTRRAWDELDEVRRRIFVEPIEAAVAQGRAMRPVVEASRGPVDDWISRADAALLDKAVTRPLLDEGLALRERWLGTCTAAGRAERHCAADELGRPLARRIIALAVVLKDGPLARAETALWSALTDVSDTRYAVVEAVAEAKGKEQGIAYARAEAQRNGVAEEEIQKRFGPPVPERFLDATAPLAAGAVAPAVNLPRADHLTVTRTERDLARIDVKGGKATLQFTYSTWTSTYGTGCYETNKIIGYDTSGSYGRIVYETRCTGPDKTVRESDKVPAVTMPATEAEGLEVGMHVVVLSAPGFEGRLVEARDAKGRVVRRHGVEVLR